eukprot:FR738215.1.p1 GENE.FR738215.1~~FR738215.1.p1  ORF type:complete len:166 (+),score=23.75 FR738215.1:72-569(+)
MGGTKGRRGRTGPAVKIKRTMKGSVRAKYLEPTFTMDSIKERWNPNMSQHANLEKMGLAADPNGKRKLVQRNERGGGLVAGKALVKSTVDPNELFQIPESDDLRSVDVNSRRRNQPMMEKDQKFIKKLINKHGTKYDAMARDMKLNDRQLTAPRLEKLAARYLLI